MNPRSSILLVITLYLIWAAVQVSQGLQPASSPFVVEDSVDTFVLTGESDFNEELDNFFRTTKDNTFLVHLEDLGKSFLDHSGSSQKQLKCSSVEKPNTFWCCIDRYDVSHDCFSATHNPSLSKLRRLNI